MVLSAEWQEALSPCSCGPVDICWPQFDIDPPDAVPIRIHDSQCEEVTGRPAPWDRPAMPDTPGPAHHRIDHPLDVMAEQMAYREEQDNRDLGGQW